MAASVPVLEQRLPERPHHQRKQSSKSNLFKALVSPIKTKPKGSTFNHQDPTDAPLKQLGGRPPRILEEKATNMHSPPRARSCHASHLRHSQQGQSISSDRSMRSRQDDKTKKLKDKENSTPRTSTETDGPPSHTVLLPPQADRNVFTPRTNTSTSPRKISDSSTESASPKKSLSIMKRGARVMAAVAAIQTKTIPITPTIQEADEQLNPTHVEARFEAMLDNRNVAPAMRDKMRKLTLRMKADLVKQEHNVLEATTSEAIEDQTTAQDHISDDATSTKRSRPRSRTFTFSRGDRHADDSPSKKQRGRSRSRPAPIKTGTDTSTPAAAASAPSTPRRSSARGSRTENPADYITYLQKEQNPTKVEVGRLHKLRILLRNETVAWVDSFVAHGGLTQITALLDHIMALEWREEHEDQLLHETLLCLKGLCTTASALSELSKLADTLFPALLAMLFDDERKGPAEYATRAIIINVLFAYLSANSAQDVESRAKTMLSYLSKPNKTEDSQPLDFVMDMRTSRPYKLWCREITNVTREVFWIFLHQLNIIPAPKTTNESESTYISRHFPRLRPPVPAAPYIGGVEWDATCYITGHLDLLNGLIASLPTRDARNALRQDLEASGFEKVMGATLRTCKEKFYAGVHDGLRAWVAAAQEDSWPIIYVSEGPTLEEQARNARGSPKKAAKQPPAPQLDDIKLGAPRLDLDLGPFTTNNDNDNNGWLDA